MASIHPFKGIIYAPPASGDITPLIAPPYDVIDSGQREQLANRDPHNIVHLILPQAPGGSDIYASAAGQFNEWLSEEILTISDTPVMYVWEQEYNHDGDLFRRRALVTRVDCNPYQIGGVVGHERTHSGPKEDRLRLFKATAAQFSQVFSIFNDGDHRVTPVLAETTEKEPLLVARGDDGHASGLYLLDDKSVIASLQEMLAGKTILIADGHHRYETSLAYYQESGQSGATLMTLVPDSDPGLIVLPTHRVISLPVTAADFHSSLPRGFSAEIYDQAEWARLYAEAMDNPDQGLLTAVAPGEGLTLRIKWQLDTLPSVQDTSSPRLRSDAVILHEHLLGGIPVLKHEAIKSTYIHEAGEAVQRAGEIDGWTFLLRPTTTETLLKIAERGEILPPKSTYFFPKFLSGFINAYLD